MDKKEFLNLLQKGLAGLPQEDMDERLNFYSEMIDDYVEEGLTEDEAVSRIGSANEIASQILADTPPSKLASESTKPAKKRSAWNVTLIILGSPIWVSLLIAAFAVILSLFVSLWAIIISFWSIFASLAACALAGILYGAGLVFYGYWQTGLILIGAGLVLAGLSIFAYYGCKAVTKGMVWLTRKCALAFKNRLKKKEAAK